jgi:hypothetical protein
VSLSVVLGDTLTYKEIQGASSHFGLVVPKPRRELTQIFPLESFLRFKQPECIYSDRGLSRLGCIAGKKWPQKSLVNHLS